MKRYAYLLAAAALALNISCTGPENPAQPEATLKAEPASLRFAAAAAPAQTVTVTAEETEWTHSIPEDAGWLTATRDGDRLSVSVADNADETDRSASITLNAAAEGVEPVKITVRQEAAEAPEPEKPSLSVSPEKLVFAAAGAPGQEVTVTVTGGITWKASPSGAEEWIHIVPAEGKFTVTVDDNPNALERNASINERQDHPDRQDTYHAGSRRRTAFDRTRTARRNHSGGGSRTAVHRRVRQVCCQGSTRRGTVVGLRTG